MKKILSYTIILVFLTYLFACSGDDKKNQIMIDSLKKQTADYEQQLKQKEDLLKQAQENEKKIQQLQDSINKIKSKGGSYANNSNPDVSRLYGQISKLKKDNEELNKRLNSLKDANGAPITPEALNKMIIDKQNQINQMDQKIKELGSSNDNMNTKVSDLEKDKEKASKELKELKETLEIAKKAIRITDVRFQYFTKGIRKVAKNIKVVDMNYVVNENPYVESGKKTLYVSVYGPDGKIVYNKEENVFTTYNNVKLNYSHKEEFDYNNKFSIDDANLSWSVGKNELKPGTYTVKFFVDGYPSGDATFNLAE